MFSGLTLAESDHRVFGEEGLSAAQLRAQALKKY